MRGKENWKKFVQLRRNNGNGAVGDALRSVKTECAIIKLACFNVAREAVNGCGCFYMTRRFTTASVEHEV
jgi:hypothetical protein